MNKNLLGAIVLLLLLGLSFGSLSAQALTGIKQIGPGGDYTTFTAAINALNINGVGAGGVTFYVEAGATFAERPPAITATGTESDPIVFQKSGSGNNPVIRPTGTSSNNEAGIIISGGDYITFDGIDINASAVTNVEYGYLIRNASATNGAKHNTIKNMTVTMNRASTGYIYSAGIMQSTDATVGAGVTPTAQSGANDYNRYLNFSLQSSACGILMFGGDFNDQYCEITTTSDTIRNTLNNLGSTSSNISYGIYILKGSNFTVHNSDVSSITSTSDIVGGMYFHTYGGTNYVSHNNITDIANNYSSNSYQAIGLLTTHVYAGLGTIYIYNNTIANLRAASSGNVSDLRVMGMRICSGDTNEDLHIFNNTISIGYGQTWGFSSAGVVNLANSSDVTMQGNIVTNYAMVNASPAKSYCIWAYKRWLGDNATDYNLYYAPTGYVGIADGYEAGSLASWQGITIYGDEANSIYGNPYLVNPNTDLHATGARPIGLVGFSVPAYITADMDYETRGTPTALGADTYTPIDEDTSILAPVAQVPAGGLSSVANTAFDALDVLKFQISDSGGDSYPTKVTTVKIKREYIYDAAVWTTVMLGAVLKVNGTPLGTATAVITNDDITFTIPEGDFNITDGETVECALAIYFKTTGLVEGKGLKFKITAASHGFTNAFWGSRLQEILVADIISADFRIDIVATTLRLTHPKRDLINRIFSVVAAPIDANGNVDQNLFETTVMSLHTGTGTITGSLSTTINNGTCGWSISYNKWEDIKLQIVCGSITKVSDFIGINPYIEVSDPPLPQLGFENNQSWPFRHDYAYGRSVSLYMPAEVNGYYSVEALSWKVATPSSYTGPLPVKLYMKSYSGNFYGMGLTTWDTLVSGATLVYNGNVTITSAGWIKVNLSTVFTGNYNQSVIVLVESNYGVYSYHSPATFTGSYLYSQDYQYGRVDYSSLMNPLTLTKESNRPYVRFWVTSQGYYEDTVTEQSSTASISANATNQQIVRANVMTSGSLSNTTINSLTFNTNGTTDVSDIVAARVYYTGSSTTFSTTTQYGATITNFGAKGSFTVSQNLSVSSGNHYFWLVYDVGANLIIGDRFDAQCTAVSVNNTSRTPSISDPTGYRSVAGKKLGDVSVYQQGLGTVSSGAQNLGILAISLNVIEGSDAESFASLKVNSLAVTGKNTSNADVSAVKLADQTNPSSFLSSASMATGTANFSALNYELSLGMNTLYVFYDLSAEAGAGNTVDAKIIANSINVSGITHPATEQDPSGEYTIENFNYGGGYAQQGGYYFANTLATPAPSHPTFDWIDISSTGTNAYPEMTNDDGYAPNNATGYPIGFSFPYFGSSFSSFWIGADGSIYLSRPTLPLPMGQPPSNAIALFASDFFPTSANYPKTILYQNIDSKLVVTYLKAQPKTGASESSYATFQVVLFPTGKFKIQLLEFGPTFQTMMGSVYIVNSNATAFHMYAYGGQAGPVSGTSPIAVAYGQNAYMLGDTPAQNDLPVSVSGTGSASFPITGATVQFTTSTNATNLTAIRVDTNPLGILPVGILSLANRHWTINSTTTTGLGSYNLTLNLNGLPNVGGASLFYLVKRSHVSSAWENLGLPSSFDENTRLATWNISNGFSDFGIGFEEEFTLPVELSSFTAVLTAQNYVKLNWTTQSETALNGYYVYRALSSQLSTAQLVSHLIGATNSSSQQHYEYTDQELYDEGTYYYWLQSSELDGSSQFFGPVTVFFGTETEIPLPEIPTITALNRIYPNPFNPLAHISYTLKESVPVDLKIFNKRGQLVRSFSNPPNQTGLHRVLWDGNDNSGRPCSSGVYLFRMTAGKEVFTQKAILLK
ncbi:hypothetical protein MASR1M36_00390 [Candidatus Cloacimonadaceae bacterium]